MASFSPIPPAQCCFAGSKKYRKKSRHHCSNIERGETGEGFLLRVARDFWLGLYSLYMLGISMGLFQACHVIDFQKDIIKTAKHKQTWTTTGKLPIKRWAKITSCRSLEKKENRTHHNSILFGVLHVYMVTHGIGRCTTTLHHRFRAVYPCLDKIFWKLLKLNTSPSKPLKYSVKDSEFKQSMASHATSFDGEPSRLKLIEDISVLFAQL